MTAVAAKPKPLPKRGVVFELAAQASSRGQVDRANKVIRRVKLVGVKSVNPARVLGLDYRDFGDAVNQPYSYEISALRRAMPLYEGASVYSNHLKFEYGETGARKATSLDRDNADLLGQIVNVICVESGPIEDQGLYGDLEYLEANPLSESLCEVAERMPDKFKLSHEAAWDDARLKNGRVVLGAITGVLGLALVNGNAGTTNTLFESAAAVSTTLRQVFETIENADAKKLVMEMIDDYGAAADQPLQSPMDAAAGQAAVPPGGGANQQINDAFTQMAMAIFSDATLDSKGILAKLKTLLTARDKLNGVAVMTPDDNASETPAEDSSAGEETPEEDVAAENMDQPADDMAAEGKANQMDAKILLESTDLLNAKQVTATSTILETMALLPSKEKREQFVAEIAALQAPPVRTPRSAAAPKKTEEQPAAPEYKHGDFAKAFRGGI